MYAPGVAMKYEILIAILILSAILIFPALASRHKDPGESNL